ncbi:MAG: ZIP family metal transporter [Bacteroidota bacterium]|jgi:zinc transporter ZupT
MESFVAISSLLFSVILGGFSVTYLKQTNKAQVIKLLLAFSGGFLLSIAFTHFIPDLYHDGSSSIGIYILLGFLIQLLLEFFSGGIEHGHVHVHKGQAMPWGLFISLSVHSILEGIPLGHQLMGIETHDGHSHGGDSSLLLGIVFHQLPVAIALMTLLTNTRLSLLKSWMVLLLFGIMTPLGTVVGLTTEPGQIGLDFHIILAVVVGMFLHISTTIIFETSENHKFNLLKLLSIFVGCALAFFIV